MFAIFSYLLSGDECKAVIKTLESKSPAITPSNGQYQTTGSILLFQRFLPYDSKDIICDHCQLRHQFVALKLSRRESFILGTIKYCPYRSMVLSVISSIPYASRHFIPRNMSTLFRGYGHVLYCIISVPRSYQMSK